MSQNEAHELKIYELTDKTTGRHHISVSDNAQDACKQAGWLIGDCSIRDITPPPTQNPNETSPLIHKIPCQVCPYQYAECNKPAEAECPARDNTPDLNEWLKAVAKAHLCQYTGMVLTEKNYHLHQK